MALEKIWNGHTITFNESNDEWYCRELGLHSAKLSELQKRIDKHGEKEKNFDRFEAYSFRYGEWRVGTVTSIDEDNEAWMTFPEGKRKAREKIYVSDIYPVNDTNTAKLNAIRELDTQIAGLQGKRDDLKREMRNWTELQQDDAAAGDNPQ